MRRVWVVALACGLGLALSSPLFAQRTTGGIAGTVKDASGAAMPGVAVSVSGPNESGFYRVINLPPGEYEVRFALAGFKTLTRRALRVPVGSTLEENATLEVSQLQEEVEVIGESPVVDTSSNEVGSNYGREFVDNAPLRRFSFFDLVDGRISRYRVWLHAAMKEPVVFDSSRPGNLGG